MGKRCDIGARVRHRARAHGGTQNENTGQGIYKTKEYGVSGKQETQKKGADPIPPQSTNSQATHPEEQKSPTP